MPISVVLVFLFTCYIVEFRASVVLSCLLFLALQIALAQIGFKPNAAGEIAMGWYTARIVIIIVGIPAIIYFAGKVEYSWLVFCPVAIIISLNARTMSVLPGIVFLFISVVAYYAAGNSIISVGAFFVCGFSIVILSGLLFRFLIELQGRISSSVRQKSMYLSMVSHEIRTPLTSIHGLLKLMEPEIAGNQALSSQFALMRSKAAHLADLLEEILQFSYLEGHAAPIRPRAFNAGELFQDIQEYARDRLVSKDVTFSMRGSGLNVLLRGDRTKIYQAATNLVSNAIKYTLRGKIRAAMYFSDHHLEFIVADTGVGIPGEFVARIFQPFERSESAETMNTGSGIGLTVTHSLIASMHGKLRFRSRENKYSVFHWKIPIESIIRSAENEPSISPEELQLLRGKTVLIVEDDDVNAEILAAILQKYGLLSHRARNGAEGVDLALSLSSSAILMDVSMPVMDGIEATRRIRSRSAVPVIGLTAYSFAEEVDKCREAGMVEVLSKPYDQVRILKTLAHFISA